MVQIADIRRQPPAARLARSELPLGLVGLGLVLAGAWSAPLGLQVTLVAAGTGLAGVALVVLGWRALQWWRRRSAVEAVRALVDNDAAPAALSDASGRVVLVNDAAGRVLGLATGGPVAQGFGGFFATPGQTVARLLDEVARRGHACAERATRRGLVRVSALRGPGDLVLWRAESLTARDAVVGTGDIGLPMVVVQPDGRVMASNDAMRQCLGGDAPDRFDQIAGRSGWRSGDLCRVATAAGTVALRLYVPEPEPADPCREVYFLPPDIGGAPDARALFDTLPVPMVKVAVDGAVRACNAGARELLGRDLPPGSWLSDGLSGLGRPLTDWLQDAHASLSPSRSEFLQVRGDGGDRFVQVSLKPVEENGEPLLLAVLTDATELKTLEAQFVQSQKMQAIGQLAGGVAHDFNNLLTAISGHCDLLLLRHDEGDPAYGDLVQINQNANRAASLVGQLLAFSRKQTLSPEVVDLSEAMSELTHLLSRLVGETVRLRLNHDDAVPPIRVDKRQLEQVIMNLVVNARDAMPDGGEITVETAAVTLNAEMRRNRAAIPPGDYAVVRVRDTGVGIAQENLQKIFEPFFTTKKTGEGTGLGLSTAYGIVKQTGGFIFADSRPGQGTAFTLYFPASEAAARTPEPRVTAPAHVVTKGEGVVMLVEDEAPVRAFASRALRLRGYTVIEAENAEEALERLEDRALQVDVFVTDVVMPGMDGPSWVREALKTRPGTRVVFVSGYAEDALSDQQARIPNSVFLPKPFSLRDLTETVQRQLH
ncbi:ATP-binding protein [Meridianimarinicoccus sp. RP-17]|uniref:ATP-binding protein n=1 Tax=Meridianimarinicoccus zhengii TaxID=2056810 RepID=UPI000DADD364